MENEPRFLSSKPKKINNKLRPLTAFDTQLDTIVGVAALLFAIFATLGWLVPQLLSLWSS